MQPKLYVGNLSYSVTDEDLRKLFEKYGTIQTINIITDRFTARAKGFAFVEMSSGEEAQKALELDGSEFLGRNIMVSEARPQEPRSSERRGGGGGGRGPRSNRDRGGFGGGGGRGKGW